MPEQFSFIEHVVPIVGLIIAIFTYYAAVKESHHKSAQDAAGIKNDISVIKEDVSEMKADPNTLKDNYHDNKEKIIELEGRIMACEDKLKTLDREVHHG